MWQLNIVYMRPVMEGGMGKLSVDHYGKRGGKANDWISYKRDANAHANTKQALAEPVIMQEKWKTLYFLTLAVPLAFAFCMCEPGNAKQVQIQGKKHILRFHQFHTLCQHGSGGKTWIAQANLSTFLLLTLNV